MSVAPDSWKHLRLDEVAEVRLGRQRSPKNHAGDAQRPYLRAANITWSGLDLTDVATMNFTDEEMKVFALRPGDILVNEASGSPSEVGKAAMFRGEIENCGFQNTAIRVRPREPVASGEYLLLFLTYRAVNGDYVRAARGVGINHIGATTMAATEVPVPPLEEQHAIVEILEDHLSRLDAAATGLDRVEGLGDKLRKAYLRDLFAKVETSAALADLLEVSIGGVWGEEPGRGDVDVDVLRVTELRRHGVLDPSTAARRSVSNSQLQSRRLRTGDLLLEKSGGGPNTPVGRVGLVVDVPENAICSNFMQLMRPSRSLVRSEYLHLYLGHLHNVGGTAALQTASTNIRNIKASEYLRITVPTPTLEEQDAALREVDLMLSRVGSSSASVRSARSFALRSRRSLLASAFRGDLTREWRERHG